MYQQLSVDANEMMQQQLNEYRLAAEKTREDLTTEHCEELDDLVGRFSRERCELHEEIRELRVELSSEGAGGAAERPMSEIRAHFENQVAVMKRELLAQLSDVHERESEQRGVDERELKQLQTSLEECQQELAASQEEFAILSSLFDKERRECMALKLRQEVAQVVGAEREGDANPAASSGTLLAPVPAPASSPAPPVVPPQAVIATAGTISTHTLPSTPETTGTWDTQEKMLQGLPQIQAPEQEKALAKRTASSVPTESPVATPTDPTGSTPTPGGVVASAAPLVAPPLPAAVTGSVTATVPLASVPSVASTPATSGQRAWAPQLADGNEAASGSPRSSPRPPARNSPRSQNWTTAQISMSAPIPYGISSAALASHLSTPPSTLPGPGGAVAIATSGLTAGSQLYQTPAARVQPRTKGLPPGPLERGSAVNTV